MMVAGMLTAVGADGGPSGIVPKYDLLATIDLAESTVSAISVPAVAGPPGLPLTARSKPWITSINSSGVGLAD